MQPLGSCVFASQTIGCQVFNALVFAIDIKDYYRACLIMKIRKNLVLKTLIKKLLSCFIINKKYGK